MAPSGPRPPVCPLCGGGAFQRTYIEGVVEHEFIVHGAFHREPESETTHNIDEWECSVCGHTVDNGTYLENDLNAIVDAAESGLPSGHS